MIIAQIPPGNGRLPPLHATLMTAEAANCHQVTALPAVIPLVVHHGHSRWTKPVQLLELIDLDSAAKQAARAYLPKFEFLLDDLAHIDAEQLRDRKLTPAALITVLLLKTAAGNPRITAEL